jgi:microcystin-dependent protein
MAVGDATEMLLSAWVNGVSGVTSITMNARTFDGGRDACRGSAARVHDGVRLDAARRRLHVAAGVAWVGVEVVFHGTNGVAITGHANGLAVRVARATTTRGVLGDAGTVLYRSPEFHAPLALVRNDITLRKPGGVDQHVEDGESKRRHGTRSHTDELLLTDDAAIAARAADLLDEYKDPQLRVRAVTFNPAAATDGWEHALGVRISDRYLWRLKPRQGATITRPSTSRACPTPTGTSSTCRRGSCRSRMTDQSPDADGLVGGITWWPSPTLPGPKYLWPEGQLLSREAYSRLFSRIGTAFNTGGEAGDVFRLPNLTGRMAVYQGSDAAFDTLGGGARHEGRDDRRNTTTAPAPSRRVRTRSLTTATSTAFVSSRAPAPT